jgi:hypothetical protein
MSTSYLHTAVGNSEAPLERGVQRVQRFSQFLGEELQLRHSTCGIATAALQKYLKREYDIDTQRMVVALPELGVRFDSRHVVLRHEGATIDPTYSLLLEYAGLGAVDASLSPELKSYYPDAKIAIIEDQTRDEFITQFARRAFELTHSDHPVLVKNRPFVPFLTSNVEEVAAFFDPIWSPEQFHPFPSDAQPHVDEAAEHIFHIMRVEREATSVTMNV